MGYHQQILEDRWNGIIDRLQNEDIKDYVRTFWNSQNTLVRYNGLFKEIRSLVRTREQLFNFIKNLEDNLDKYLNILFRNFTSLFIKDSNLLIFFFIVFLSHFGIKVMLTSKDVENIFSLTVLWKNIYKIEILFLE